MTIRAVYPGTFDPISNGQEYLIKSASLLFDNLVVGVEHSQATRRLYWVVTVVFRYETSDCSPEIPAIFSRSSVDSSWTISSASS